MKELGKRGVERGIKGREEVGAGRERGVGSVCKRPRIINNWWWPFPNDLHPRRPLPFIHFHCLFLTLYKAIIMRTAMIRLFVISTSLTGPYGGKLWLAEAVPPLALFGRQLTGWASLHELQTCRNRHFRPNLQSPLNLLYLRHTSMSTPALLAEWLAPTPMAVFHDLFLWL